MVGGKPLVSVVMDTSCEEGAAAPFRDDLLLRMGVMSAISLDLSRSIEHLTELLEMLRWRIDLRQCLNIWVLLALPYLRSEFICPSIDDAGRNALMGETLWLTIRKRLIVLRR